MEFIEAPAFTRFLGRYLTDELYKDLQAFLMLNPDAGDIMQGTGGFRKLRWSDGRRGKGKRGGLRVIYFNFENDKQIWLMTIYDKSEADDLTATQKKALKEVLETEKLLRTKIRKAR